jgi:hypothetical protein
MAIDVFIAYARKDRELCVELGKHLSVLKRQGIINAWFDGDIIEGTEWEPELFEHLHNAKVILLLISPDFVASDFCYDFEMKKALERHDAKEARVIPIILRPVAWQSLPFAKLQLVPDSGRPVTQWSNADAAFLDVVKRIKRSISDLQKNVKLKESEKPSHGEDEKDLWEPATSPETSFPTSRITNYIKRVSGGSVVQAGTLISTHKSSGQEEGTSDEWILLVISDLVDKTNKLCDAQTSSQDGPQVDPAYLMWFMGILWELKQQGISVPAPLMGRIQDVCRRLRIPCVLT